MWHWGDWHWLLLWGFCSFVAGLLAGYITSFFLIDGEGATIFCQEITVKDVKFLEKDEFVSTLPVVGRGEVRRAEIRVNGGRIKTIAIKKVTQPSTDPDEKERIKRKISQIQSEIQTVGKLCHRNIVPLLAYVPRPTCHYLVYEYMTNGSLHDILEEEDGTQELEWPARFKIAIAVASVLEYLHTRRVVHRDIKPANVLLDNDMEARITDFGLANYLADQTFSQVEGSRGFIAPEYHSTLKYTEMCDIYSFGILLAVLVNGRLPSHTFFKHIDMMVWIRKMMASENPNQTIHPTLLGKGHEKHMLAVINVACFCTRPDPKARPTIKECILMLHDSNPNPTLEVKMLVVD